MSHAETKFAPLFQQVAGWKCPRCDHSLGPHSLVPVLPFFIFILSYLPPGLNKSRVNASACHIPDTGSFGHLQLLADSLNPPIAYDHCRLDHSLRRNNLATHKGMQSRVILSQALNRTHILLRR